MFRTSFGARFVGGRVIPLLAKAVLVLALGFGGMMTPGCGCGSSGSDQSAAGDGLELDGPSSAMLSRSTGVNARRWFRVGFTSELDADVVESAIDSGYLQFEVTSVPLVSGSVSASDSVVVGDAVDFLSKLECADSNGDGAEECSSILFRSAIPYCTGFSIRLAGVDASGVPIPYGKGARTLMDTDGDGIPNDKVLGPFNVRYNPADADHDCKSDILMTNTMVQQDAIALVAVEPEVACEADGDCKVAEGESCDEGVCKAPDTVSMGGRAYLFARNELYENESDFSRYLIDYASGLMSGSTVLEGDPDLYGGLLRNHPDDTGLGASDSSWTYFVTSQIAGDLNGDGWAESVVSRFHVDMKTGETDNQELLIWEDGFGEGVPKQIPAASTMALPFPDNDGMRSFQVPGLIARLGDVNNDGYDDMAVVSFTLIGADKGGQLDLYLGSAEGAPLVPSASYAFPKADEVYPLVAKGIDDVDGDGVDDFALTTVSYTDTYPVAWNGFQVMIFRGCDAADATCTAEAIATPDLAISQPSNTETGFGISFSGGGDVNNDGFNDLVIGAPEGFWTIGVRAFKVMIDEKKSQGNYDRFAGFAADLLAEMGLSKNIAAPLSSIAPGDAEDVGLGKAYVFFGGARFAAGANLTQADADAVITGNNDQEAEGLGYLFGNMLGTADAFIEEITGASPNLPEITRLPDMFGMAVMIGEINNDGLGDVLVGAPLAVDFRKTNFMLEAINVLRTERNVPGIIAAVNEMIGEVGKVYIFPGLEADFGSATYADAKGTVVGSSSRHSFGFGALMNSAVDVDNDGSDDVMLGGFTLGTRAYDVDHDGTDETGPDLKFLKSVFRGGDVNKDDAMDLVGTDAVVASTLADADASMELDLLSISRMLGNDWIPFSSYVWVK